MQLMTAKEVAKALQERLPKDSVIALHPDLPYLFVGPDILVGAKGLLYALFVPTAAELRMNLKPSVNS